MTIGDFNDLARKEEKLGGNRYPRYLMDGFWDAFSSCDLHDVPTVGFKFTWILKRNRKIITREKLDHAVANPGWSKTVS